MTGLLPSSNFTMSSAHVKRFLEILFWPLAFATHRWFPPVTKCKPLNLNFILERVRWCYGTRHGLESFRQTFSLRCLRALQARGWCKIPVNDQMRSTQSDVCSLDPRCPACITTDGLRHEGRVSLTQKLMLSLCMSLRAMLKLWQMRMCRWSARDSCRLFQHLQQCRQRRKTSQGNDLEGGERAHLNLLCFLLIMCRVY